MKVSNQGGVVKQTGIRLPIDLYKQIKIRALERGVPASQLVAEAMRIFLKTGKSEAKNAA